MTHPRPGGEIKGQGMYEEVLQSQYAIMAHLLERQNDPVFLESATQEWIRDVELNPDDPSTELARQQVHALKILFPSIPPYYSYLSELQRDILAEEGLSVGLMAKMGYVAAVMPTAPLDSKKATYTLEEMLRFEGIRKGLIQAKDEEEAREAGEMMFNIFQRRERAALQRIQDYGKKNPQVKRVVLLFGALHDFVPYEKDFPDLQLKVVNPRYYLRRQEDLLSANPPSRFEQSYYDAATGTLRPRYTF